MANHLAESLTGGLIMLKEIAEQLPLSERKIALYIMENPQEAIRSTANELGELSATSASAVIRLCKSLGLSGFQELKLRIAGDIRNTSETDFTDFISHETQQSIVQKMTNNSIRSLQETAEIMNYEALARAVEVIKQAEKIHFYGIGASGVIAQDAHMKFVRINPFTTSSSDYHLSAMLVTQTRPKDVVIGISFSGETFEVSKVLELAKQKGATTISLTSYGLSPLSEMADINLYVSPKQEEVFRSAATSSRLAQLHVIDILFISVLTADYDTSIELLDEVRLGIQFVKQLSKK
ncbi:MurR/RpiR family transcriptional regulator [Paenibacillus oryzisoli]|uniref:RpiR family transcriptional regulator n=1 Tax=Paenibacillus oryzisoli TaxID=1850517 RepID=A0A197ZYA8_9BACL|nr:MurR/RpiR family transcriptional regulator [Paenibacillus oryzisoli]OAS13980.1 RpiR family transcriptional regulator [Paenibacillus oryzisoli]